MSGYAGLFQCHKMAEKINDTKFHNKYPVPETGSCEIWNLENRTWKPDFSMTNAGLHIQLPNEPLPFEFDRLPLPWQQQRFAYLGCRTKSNQMVGIFLQKQALKGPLAYSRMAFDGRTTFSVDLEACRGKPMPMTDYKPIWISPYRIQPPCNPYRIPQTTQLIRYEVWIKTREPLPIVTRATAHKSESARSAHYIPPPPMYEETVPPKQFTDSKLPIRHYINGVLCVGQFDHEVISVGSPRNSLYIAFGECDGFLWIQNDPNVWPARSNTNEYQQLFQSFSFPAGSSWTRRVPKMQSMVEVMKGHWVPMLTPKRTATTNRAASGLPSIYGYKIDAFMENGAPGELGLKIYVVGSK